MVKSALFFRLVSMKTAVCLIICLLVLGCREPGLGNITNSLASQDRQLPVLEEMEILDGQTISLVFSENVTLEDARLDGVRAEAVQEGGNSVLILSPHRLTVSDASTLFVRVRDRSYNSAAFSLTVHGHNDRLAAVQINEFSSKGTETQPQRIELEVRGDGNLEGLCIMDGTMGNETHAFTFPSLEVRKGDYVVVFWTAVPEEEEILQEDGSRTINLTAASGEGLPTNNGALVLYESPGSDAGVIDCLVYTNAEAVTYSGFGSRRVEASYNELTADFDWMGPAFNSKHSTSTRSVSRRLGLDNDTNRASDFFITETRGQSFGFMNGSREYLPDD